MGSLSPSDIINIILCCLSFTLATLSIIFVVLNLRQNSKMIENSTRPYISIYYTYINRRHYLTMKNFGSSSATITAFSSDINLELYTVFEGHVPFQNIVNTNFAPNQTMTFQINGTRLCQEYDLINFEYKYNSQTKSYSEQTPINLAAYNDNVRVTENLDKKDAEYVIKAAYKLLQNYIEHKL